LELLGEKKDLHDFEGRILGAQRNKEKETGKKPIGRRGISKKSFSIENSRGLLRTFAVYVEGNQQTTLQRAGKK